MKKPLDYKKTQKAAPQQLDFAAGPDNYKLMGIAFAAVVLGFILMAGSSDIYSPIKVFISPLFIVAGYVFGIYAVMKKPKSEDSDKQA